MSRFPEGELKVYKNNGSFRWYLIQESKYIYIPKKNRKLAEKYAKKQMITLEREALLEKKYYIENAVSEFSNAESKLKWFMENPGYFELLPNNIGNARSIEEWRNKKYNTNPNYPEKLKYCCPDGKYVRSKSEVFISMALSHAGIPYRYEAELIIGENKFYPDFTILNPHTKSILYWEHLGRMDDVDYARGVYMKLKVLYQNGLIPGKNLFLSFETQDNPFSYAEAEAIIATMKL